VKGFEQGILVSICVNKPLRRLFRKIEQPCKLVKAGREGSFSTTNLKRKNGAKGILHVTDLGKVLTRSNELSETRRVVSNAGDDFSLFVFRKPSRQEYEVPVRRLRLTAADVLGDFAAEGTLIFGPLADEFIAGGVQDDADDAVLVLEDERRAVLLPPFVGRFALGETVTRKNFANPS